MSSRRPARWCWGPAGLADEILVNLAPVLLGAGSRLLLLDVGLAELEPVYVLETPQSHPLAVPRGQVAGWSFS